jgi:DNA excision repair protein ERCC-4
MIEITVDDRERSDHLLTALQQSGIKILIKRLEIGDYLIDNLVIERKSLTDFCASIADGRLFRQAARLAAISKQPLIILEGAFDDRQKMNITTEAIQGALFTLLSSSKFQCFIHNRGRHCKNDIVCFQSIKTLILFK